MRVINNKNINQIDLETYITYSLNRITESKINSFYYLSKLLRIINAKEIPLVDFCYHFNLPNRFSYIMNFIMNKSNAESIIKFSKFYQTEEYKKISNMSLKDYLNYMTPKVIDMTPERFKVLQEFIMDSNAEEIQTQSFRLHFGLPLNIFCILDYIMQKDKYTEICEYGQKTKKQENKQVLANIS